MDSYTRLIDPTAEQVRQVIQLKHRGIYGQLNASLPPLPNLDFIFQHPSSVMLHHLQHDDLVRFSLLVARWSDPLGRHHWAIGADEDDRTFVVWTDKTNQPAEWFITGEHPLIYIAPPLTVGYLRTLDGGWHLRVGCRCGVVGSPESIGWMGQQCGPCHDREQDEPPQEGRQQAHSMDWLLALGSHGWITLAHDANDRQVQCRDAQTAALRWNVSLQGLQRVTANEQQIVARGSTTLWQLDPGTGAVRTTIEPGANLKAAVPLGQDRIVTLHPRCIKYWLGQRQRSLQQTVALRHPAHWHLAVAVPWQRLAVCTTGGIETFDAQGTSGERYVAHPPGAVDYAEWLPEGGLIGVRRSGHSARLYRWQPSASASAGAGLFVRWLGRDGVAPVAQALHDDCRHLRVTPCGRYALYTGSNADITLVETQSLQGLARFQFARRSHRLSRELYLALTADGRVGLSDGQRLVAYLWRELFEQRRNE
ncbi:MAG: hypothetical protein SNJ82_01575 [Gemmataceae bacterium]